MSKIPQQIIPLIILFALVISSLFVARYFLVPDSFGDLGHYRADSVEEIKAQIPVYAGYQVCYDCHDDIYDLKADSYHKGVSCEACHGPAGEHVEAPDEVTPNIPRGRGYCPLCHGYNPSRPSGFPQIMPERHNPGQECMECHDPHNPLLPHAPEECSACHRDIANVKMVSHHVNLACTVCHEAPDEHMSNPKFVKAQKPTSKETCGNCHDENSDSDKKIPKIDIETHSERYLCWDCHYPHHPEANL
jgi:hypothetical protein